MNYELHLGDNREILRSMPSDSVDSIVSDPPYELGFMGKRWDSTGIAYDVTLWAECLRVLKPGGHLLAFGGSRTYHRLAVAIEDAGFEIRDCIMWLYGSGFPKSLAVDKAIDRQRHDREQVYQVTAWIRAMRDRAGLNNGDIDKAFGFNTVARHWTDVPPNGKQPAVPTLDQIPPLLALFGMTLDDVPDDVRTLIWTLNGRKGQPGEAWFQREVVGESSNGIAGGTKELAGQSKAWGFNAQYDITAPATPLAQQWQGWGTALKPATENIIMAYKPHGTEHGIIIANLQKLEAQLWLMQYACSAEWSSTSSPSELGVALSIAQWTVAELISTRDDLLGQMDTLQLSEMVNMCLSIVQSWKNTWEEASKLGNTFITETVLSPIIGWTTLKSSLSHLTLNFIIREWTQHDTEWLNVLSAASPFIVASKKLKSTLELIAVESAISRTSNPADIDARITVEPIVVARKPLQGTVADNVQAWEVGALNIDGCRIDANGETYERTGLTPRLRGYHGIKSDDKIFSNPQSPLGRWPANIVLDEEAAQMLDEQSGGASRFFYVAKASKAEREAGLEGMELQRRAGLEGSDNDGELDPLSERWRTSPRANHHPTVKPIALMRYLVRMVTPRGGVVLDPFMGSGTTGCAAMLEAVRFIGIDITPEYKEIAERRIQYWASQNPMGL